MSIKTTPVKDDVIGKRKSVSAFVETVTEKYISPIVQLPSLSSIYNLQFKQLYVSVYFFLLAVSILQGPREDEACLENR